jgi:hypothetical protein
MTPHWSTTLYDNQACPFRKKGRFYFILNHSQAELEREMSMVGQILLQFNLV